MQRLRPRQGAYDKSMRDYKGDIESFRPTIMGVPAVWELVKEAFCRRSTVVARFACLTAR